MAVSSSAIQIINNSKNNSELCFRQGYSKEQHRKELKGREESKQLLFHGGNHLFTSFVIRGHLCCSQNKQVFVL